ncbi:ABC transporter permease [bacterium]|nr:ABC transporter permease [bacterium]MBU1024957.1 ABC transporter permease [bacterium]
MTIIKMALKGLMANKLRSILAMLGIIIGVGAVISMLAIGTGAEREQMNRISAMGTNLLVVRPGMIGSRGVHSGTRENLTLDDAKAILEQIKGIDQISPVVASNSQVKFFNKNEQVNITGAAVTYPWIRNFKIAKGRFFSETEVENKARVAILGPETAEKLEFTEANVGESIKLQGLTFKVIGLFESKGDQGWYNPDDLVMIPYTTAMKTVFGLDFLREIDIQVKKNVSLVNVETEIATLLKRRHKIQPGQEDDFYIRNQADLIEMASETNRTFKILLGSIASISLLVGGIGIMNIMLVTVTERTREIGIRKAIGAKDRDILRQFLIEALIMSVIGGFIGVGAGIGASKVIGNATEFVTVIELPGVILALSFSMAVGVFFGYYPARRAAVLDPIESLYYE